MSITNHAIQRFRERITEESVDFIRSFIQSSIKSSTVLFSVDGIEKREFEGMIFIVDPRGGKDPVVRTVYLA